MLDIAYRFRRALIALTAIVAAGLVSACTPTTVLTAGTVVGVLIDTYCKGVSPQAKQGIRDATTHGKQVLCDESSVK